MRVFILVLLLSFPALALEKATFGGGCFWCLEACFERLKGVTEVTSGYAGGTVANPDYKSVCTGSTGHAEVVQITYDPALVSYHDLLKVLFTIHDPTTLNRQGNDTGTQYRSVIFYQSPAQEKEAKAYLQEAQKEYTRPIVTLVQPLATFYPAEAYHQDYFRKNPNAGYCQLVVAPKVTKFESKFKARSNGGNVK